MREPSCGGQNQNNANSSGGVSSQQESGTRPFRHGRETVEFSVKGPVGVSMSDERLMNTGCSVLDLQFTAPSTVGELTFRNYYTMWLTVLVKTKLLPLEPGAGTNIGSLPTTTHKDENISEWVVSVQKKVLMQYPHQENGSHDLVSISCSESAVEWKSLIGMRLVLRQPSPVWKTFHVEEINVYKDLPRRAPTKEIMSDSLMVLIKKQTLNALRWLPSSENPQSCGGYEFNCLPQP